MLTGELQLFLFNKWQLSQRKVCLGYIIEVLEWKEKREDSHLETFCILWIYGSDILVIHWYTWTSKSAHMYITWQQIHSFSLIPCEWVSECVCVHACVRACMRMYVCVRVSARMCVHACVWGGGGLGSGVCRCHWRPEGNTGQNITQDFWFEYWQTKAGGGDQSTWRKPATASLKISITSSKWKLTTPYKPKTHHSTLVTSLPSLRKVTCIFFLQGVYKFTEGRYNDARKSYLGYVCRKIWWSRWTAAACGTGLDQADDQRSGSSSSGLGWWLSCCWAGKCSLGNEAGISFKGSAVLLLANCIVKVREEFKKSKFVKPPLHFTFSWWKVWNTCLKLGKLNLIQKKLIVCVKHTRTHKIMR